MTPEAFEAANTVLGAKQDEYENLPAFIDVKTGVVTTRWRLTFWEKIQLLFGAGIRLDTLTFGKNFQPVKLEVWR